MLSWGILFSGTQVYGISVHVQVNVYIYNLHFMLYLYMKLCLI